MIQVSPEVMNEEILGYSGIMDCGGVKFTCFDGFIDDKKIIAITKIPIDDIPLEIKKFGNAISIANGKKVLNWIRVVYDGQQVDIN